MNRTWSTERSPSSLHAIREKLFCEGSPESDSRCPIDGSIVVFFVLVPKSWLRETRSGLTEVFGLLITNSTGLAAIWPVFIPSRGKSDQTRRGIVELRRGYWIDLRTHKSSKETNTKYESDMVYAGNMALLPLADV
jgi:hypothetical protein